MPEAESCADHADFQAFVERNMRFAFRVAWALLRNRSDADDVVQECFLRLYRKRAWRDVPGLAEEIKDEHAYLARVVWRMARDRQRRPAREEGGMEMDTIFATDHSPETAAVSSSGIARIHQLIDTLPEELRQPLVLSSLEEMTSAQIGIALGIPEGTVRTRIQRARMLLKQKLAPQPETRHAR
ncbi:MAG TPA: sigma-70 family RNA polymerase sigma factor [Acidobacteriaceae bacterium]|nr:sigma-70 family RNA polymerase sigma factor [Acidobacteriaceae bacterium]